MICAGKCLAGGGCILLLESAEGGSALSVLEVRRSDEVDMEH